MDNNEKLYDELVRKFVSKYYKVFEVLERMNDDEQKILIHTFKGMSATLGINKLNSALIAFEKENNTYNQSIAKLALEEFLKAVTIHTELVQHNEVSVMSQEVQGVFIDDLKNALHSSMPKKIKTVMHELDYATLDESYEDKIKIVREHIALYEFELALKILDA